MSHMKHVPQALYTPRPHEALFAREPDINFNACGQYGITLDAALRLEGPREWEEELMCCFSMAKKITIRILVESCSTKTATDHIRN